MHLFPAEGIMAVILSYGQMLSLFLVLFFMEGVIAARTETSKPGLIFLGLVFLLAVFVGWYFKDVMFFVYMQIPVVLCALAFAFSRYNRKRNLEKGAVYNEEGIIEENSLQE